MSAEDESLPASPTEPRVYPRYVRVLAVIHVVSYLLGPLGFIVLGSLAGILWMMRGLDGWVIGLGIAGPAWVFTCILFRAWFVRFGRRHWPQPEGSGTEPATPESTPT